MKTLCIDTETTGLLASSLVPLSKQPRIIEFSAILIEAETEIDIFDQLINPGFPLEAIITSITGISDADLSSAPPFATVAADIKRRIEEADEVVAHNLSFDKKMIDNDMKREGLEIKWPSIICSVENSEHYCGFRLNLNALHEYLFGVGFTGAHRAGADTAALAKCFSEMRKRGDV